MSTSPMFLLLNRHPAAQAQARPAARLTILPHGDMRLHLRAPRRGAVASEVTSPVAVAAAEEDKKFSASENRT